MDSVACVDWKNSQGVPGERLSTKSDWLKILHLSFDRFRLCIGSIAKCTKQKKIDNTKMITVTAVSRN